MQGTQIVLLNASLGVVGRQNVGLLGEDANAAAVFHIVLIFALSLYFAVGVPHGKPPPQETAALENVFPLSKTSPSARAMNGRATGSQRGNQRFYYAMIHNSHSKVCRRHTQLVEMMAMLPLSVRGPSSVN